MPEEKVVDRIMELSNEGWRLAQIAELLNQEKKRSNETWFRPPTLVPYGTASRNKEDCMAKKKKVVCGYLRVSSSRQDAMEGLEAQKRACVEMAEFLGLEVDPGNVYTDVGPGDTLDRPQLAKLLHSIANGEVSEVICYSTSRLCRKRGDLLRVTGPVRRPRCEILLSPEPHGIRSRTVVCARGRLNYRGDNSGV